MGLNETLRRETEKEERLFSEVVAVRLRRDGKRDDLLLLKILFN